MSLLFTIHMTCLSLETAQGVFCSLLGLPQPPCFVIKAMFTRLCAVSMKIRPAQAWLIFFYLF